MPQFESAQELPQLFTSVVKKSRPTTTCVDPTTSSLLLNRPNGTQRGWSTNQKPKHPHRVGFQRRAPPPFRPRWPVLSTINSMVPNASILTTIRADGTPAPRTLYSSTYSSVGKQHAIAMDFGTGTRVRTTILHHAMAIYMPYTSIDIHGYPLRRHHTIPAGHSMQ